MRRELATAEFRWVDVADPTKADLNFLQEAFHFRASHVAECARLSVRSRVEFHPEYIYLIIHTPKYSPEQHATMPVEFDVFVTPQAVVTVHAKSAKQLDTLFREAEKDAEASDRVVGRGAASLLYRILDRLFDAAFPMLDHLIVNLGHAEERMFTGEERRMVTALTMIQRDLAGFRSLVRPQRNLYDPVMLQGSWDTPTFHVVFRSVHGKLLRLWDHLETLWERADALTATNAVLVNNKLNEFVKMLTVLGALFIPFGLIAQVAVFLNDGISMANRVMFWGIISVMLLTDFIILWRAREKGIL